MRLDELIRKECLNPHLASYDEIEAVAKKFATAELKRVLEEIREGGFCPDNDFRNHINYFIKDES